MQRLSWSEAEDVKRPEICEHCSGEKFHSHGTYARSVVRQEKVEKIRAPRYLCVKCRGTTSVLPAGVLPYRVLSETVVRVGLYEPPDNGLRELLGAYRRRWERWYMELRMVIGNLYGKLSAQARAGWEELWKQSRINVELVEVVRVSLFGCYAIHQGKKMVRT